MSSQCGAKLFGDSATMTPASLALVTQNGQPILKYAEACDLTVSLNYTNLSFS